MSVWTLLCTRHNCTVAENSASSDLPLCTSNQTANRRDELGDLERTLQGLIDDFQAALTGQRRRDEFWRRLKRRADGSEGPRAGVADPGPRVNVEGELGLLRRLMRTLRRWRSGSEAVTERGVDEMREYVARTRERLLLHRLERTSMDREDAGWVLREWSVEGDGKEVEGGLAEEVGGLEREMEALNVRISALTRRGLEMERILEMEKEIDRLHRKAEELRDRLVAMVMGCTDNSSNSSSDISPPPEPCPSFLSGTLIDPNNTQYHPLINHLFRLAGKNRRLIEALRRGGHRTGTDENGNDMHGTVGQTGSAGKHSGNDEKRGRNWRLKTGRAEDQSGSGEKKTGTRETKTGNREKQIRNGEKQTGSREKETGNGENITGNGENKTGNGENKTGNGEKQTEAVSRRRRVKFGERIVKCGPEVDALEKRVCNGGVLPTEGVRSRVRWVVPSGEEWERCSMLDAEVLLDQLRRMKRWLGQRELFSSAEIREIERRTNDVESHLRWDVNLDSHSLLQESHFFIEDIDSMERTRTYDAPFLALSDDERATVPAPRPSTHPTRTKPTVTKSVSYTDSVNIANERLI